VTLTFADLPLRKETIAALNEHGYTAPFPIQEQVLSIALAVGDVIGQAKTGTGKTLAFGIPLVDRVIAPADEEWKNFEYQDSPQVLVVVPTRELCVQVTKDLEEITQSRKIRVLAVYGGRAFEPQIEALQKGVEIIVGTPGRLLDLIERESLNLETIQYLVLDEADEMLSLGFKKQLNEILKLAANRRSTWLFSATFPEAIQQLIKGCMSASAKSIKIDQGNIVNRDIDHRFAICKREDKTEFITDFLRRQKDARGLIFCRTRAGAVDLGRELTAAGLSVDVLQGDLMQKERDKIMRAFKKERVQFMIATDVVARGIDVAGLTFVIHHQLPDQLEYYTHRSGRTARAGKKGVSVALVDPKEKWRIPELEKTLRLTFREYHP
jgi:ATP-dependent RNA helicase DeaD